MKNLGLVISLFLFTCNAFASEKGYSGLTLTVDVSGFFSPQLQQVQVKAVDTNSPADRGGIAKGDYIIAFEDCKVPGCSAKRAKMLMSQSAGNEVHLTLKRSDGSIFQTTILFAQLVSKVGA